MRKARTFAGFAVILGLAAGMAAAEGHTSEFEGNKGYVGEKGYVGPVAAYPSAYGHITYRHRSERRSSGPLYAVPPCPVGFNGMYRGTLYCVNGRPMS